MGKQLKDLTGQKINKLTVLSKSGDSFIMRNKTWQYYNCQCECGKIVKIRNNNLTKTRTISCGCIREINLIGKIFNRLIVISKINKNYLCQCICGKQIMTNGNHLNSGNTKSCGCLKLDLSIKRIKINPISNYRIKYSPLIASAKRFQQNNYKETPFEVFYDLSQKPCTYCNSKPNQIFNKFKNNKPEGNFIYNGLDRINSSKDHSPDNILTSCRNCNRMKSNHSIYKFLQRINNIGTPYLTNNIKILNKYQINSLKERLACIYDNDISIELFVNLSRQNCYYCNQTPINFSPASINKYNKDKHSELHGAVYSNGLDRLYNEPDHKNNIVTCCKFCNFSKLNMKLDEFYNHVNKIKQNQRNIVRTIVERFENSSIENIF